MRHESVEKEKLEVKEIKFNMDIYLQNYIRDKNLKAAVKNADIILLPYNNFREVQGPIFAEENIRFYDYLFANAKNKKVEICVEEDDYKEIALHDELINLGIIFLNGLLLPIISGLILDYIKNKRGNRKSKVKVTLIEKQGNSYQEFKYEGNPEYLSQTLDNYVNNKDKNED